MKATEFGDSLVTMSMSFWKVLSSSILNNELAEASLVVKWDFLTIFNEMCYPWRYKWGYFCFFWDMKKVIEYHDKALKIYPIFEVWWNKGNILSHLGRYREALECENKALKINPYALKWNSNDLLWKIPIINLML